MRRLTSCSKELTELADETECVSHATLGLIEGAL